MNLGKKITKKEKSKISEKEVTKELGKINDPEIAYSVVDLGLIYGVRVYRNKISIAMTLTSPFCPYADSFVSEIKRKIHKKFKTETEIKLTFEPLWSPERLNPELKSVFGY